MALLLWLIVLLAVFLFRMVAALFRGPTQDNPSNFLQGNAASEPWRSTHWRRGVYLGGRGSSHRGGIYINASTGNRYRTRRYW
jgi:hypothetical protein